MIKLRVGELVKAKGLTVRAFAAKAGIAYPTAWHLRAGKVGRIELETLDKICTALDVTPCEIFEYAPPKPKRKKAAPAPEPLE